MTLKNKIIPAVAALGLLGMAVTPALAYPARSESAVNVRSGPGTQYDVVGQLDPGQRVNVSSSAGGWSHIGGGWVSSNYLTASAGYAAPNYGYSYDDTPYYDDGYAGPPVSFGFSFGTGHGWHGGGNHWRGGHGWHH